MIKYIDLKCQGLAQVHDHQESISEKYQHMLETLETDIVRHS